MLLQLLSAYNISFHIVFLIRSEREAEHRPRVPSVSIATPEDTERMINGGSTEELESKASTVHEDEKDKDSEGTQEAGSDEKVRKLFRI